MNKDIIIKGARENNLKDISLKIPRDKLVVMTGLSRRTAPLCRIFVGVCATVLRTNGQARC